MTAPLTQSFDAQVWARDWLQTIKDYPGIPTDEGAMIGWFANAIMAGYDEASRRATDPALERLKEAAVAYGNGSTRWKGYDNDLKATAEAYAASRKAKT